ncbi:DUF1799 domain-containing protein [Pseudomonas nitroreducens]|uniref:DUF1799 domain-containing protein n=1 Tax=Pseudomonas nitroreducens TaxID=46680 RepID=UPI0018CBB438
MAALGLTRDDIADQDVVYVLPDNWLPLRVFQSMSTQWRIGMSGASGLDYSALPTVMKFEGVRKRDRLDVFDCVQVLERAALDIIHTKD